MRISSRIKSIPASITLELNAKATQLAEKGNEVFNLTAGQLPFRPSNEFVELIRGELNFLKSFQYSPVSGFVDLRKKFMSYLEKSRGVSLPKDQFDVLVSNGGKHSLYNVLGAIIDPSDEVIVLAPYWISYPEMVKFWAGTPVVVQSSIYDSFIPSVEEIEKKIGPKTKAIIVNSPNNPSGVHYPQEWMEAFASMIEKYPNVILVSDEIYFEVFYFDPKPTYFYQYNPKLLERTVIIEGISKALASTGLRIGYAVATKDLVQAGSLIQGQTTSGANSLIQRALVDFDFDQIGTYLVPIRDYLRGNSRIIREKLIEVNLSHCFYQPISAFYFLFDFSQTPLYARYKKEKGEERDFSNEMCAEILEKTGVAIVPGTDFGIKNSARLSLVLEKAPFTKAIEKLTKFVAGEG